MKRQRGFTLIELLTVIAIIGILAAIIIPTLSGSRARAQRIVDASNLSQIIKAAINYAADNNDRLPNPDLPGQLSAAQGVFLWPGLLARAGALSEPGMYFSALDPAFDGEVPAALLNPQNRNLVDSAFSAGRELSWEFVGGLRMSDPSTTPVAFTRGLRPDGTWDPADGVYGDTGGYVVFLGGNVEFFSSNASGKFIHTQTGQRTDNLLEALPRRAGIKVWATSRGGIGSPGGTPAPAL
ncbi:hypothetical protein AXK11_04785 [Cephaloticoccus primus]|uniref:Prepilin-type N-terminal cleavage/methylation domain-containing protein n=1 Tax=Cephaloticoccus primus TaxID=1548207 RepID=A0A139SN47_9BACT|nr:type II secretion system protein [Cephaloticoccus primus]KXU35998.1 hypothetical protein AXK11_04785 [Cephaloticoccus primus]